MLPMRPGMVERHTTWYNTEHRHSGVGLLTPAPCIPDGRPRSMPLG